MMSLLRITPGPLHAVGRRKAQDLFPFYLTKPASGPYLGGGMCSCIFCADPPEDEEPGMTFDTTTK